MRKILHFVLGFSLVLGIFLIYFLTFIKIGKFNLFIVISLIVLQSVISLLLYRKFKNKQIRIGILFTTIPLILFLCTGLLVEVYDKKTKPSQKTFNIEKSEEDRRYEIMNNEGISLFEKFNELKLGKLSDSIIIAFTLKNTETKKSKFSINSLKFNLSTFDTVYYPKNSFYSDSTNFKIYKNSILIVTKNNKKIVEKLKPSDGSDSIVYLGYMPKEKFFLFAEGISEYGIDYKTINAITGQEIEGIPIFKSYKGEYSVFVYFYHFIGDLKLIIKFWRINKNNNFQLIHSEDIPLCVYIKNYNNLPYEISNTQWDKNSFNFTLTKTDTIQENVESINIEFKIVDLKKQ